MIYGRFQQKIDTSENWAKAVNFKPLEGEIIIYSDLNKYKTGDGVTLVNDLPFSNITPKDWNQNDENAEDYIANRTHYDMTVVVEHGDPSNDSLIDYVGEYSPMAYHVSSEDFSSIVDGTLINVVSNDGETYAAIVEEGSVKGSWYCRTVDPIPPGAAEVAFCIAYCPTVGSYPNFPFVLFNAPARGLYFSSCRGLNWYPVRIEIPRGVKKLDKKYLPDEALNTQTDWDQEDNSKSDYLKNKPFGEKVEHLSISYPYPSEYITWLRISADNALMTNAELMDDTFNIPYDSVKDSSFTASYAEYGESAMYNGLCSVEGNENYWVVKHSQCTAVNNIVAFCINNPGIYTIGDIAVEYTLSGLYITNYAGIRWTTGLDGDICFVKKIDSVFLPNEVPLMIDGKIPSENLPEMTNLNIVNGVSGTNSLMQKEDAGKYTETKPDFVQPNALKGQTVIPKNEILGNYATAFGGYAAATGKRSLAEGTTTWALGDYSHAEGNNSVSEGHNSHAEGKDTWAVAINSHTEGELTMASGNTSHAEGQSTKAMSFFSHAEGQETVAGVNNGNSWSDGAVAHAEGYQTKATGFASHAEGNNTQAKYDSAHAEGINTISNGEGSHAEGVYTQAGHQAAHAEGQGAEATNISSHAEGWYTKALCGAAHAEGIQTEAGADIIWNEYEEGGAHAEGWKTKATRHASHAEGGETRATSEFAHAEGYGTVASGYVSHAQGTNTLASGMMSHAEGESTIASGKNSHASGLKTIASGANQTAVGQWNAEDNEALFIVGNGTADWINGAFTNEQRRNAFAVMSSSTPTIKIGNTTLTEAQLIKILNFIDSIEG